MNILIVDDGDDNRYYLEFLLKKNGHTVQTASNGKEALELLDSHTFHLIISDILMPVMDGFELCRKVKTDEQLKSIPFIIYTATYTGAQDKLFSSKIGADLFIKKPCDPDIFMKAVHELTSEDKIRKNTVSEPANETDILKLYNERLVNKLEQKMVQLEKEVQSRIEAEGILRSSEMKYRSLFSSIRDAIIVTDTRRSILNCNPAFTELFGYTFAEIEGKNTLFLCEKKEDFMKIESNIKVYEKGEFFFDTVSFRKKNGEVFPAELTISSLIIDDGEFTGFIGIIRDITERRQAETTEKDLESRLHQAQKMEAIGLLAGGIAHDFNNILTVIIGNADMGLLGLNPDEPLCQEIRQIKNAGERAAELTRQLLAFSRKQPILPVPSNLNTLITKNLSMVKRLIGENIEIKLKTAADLWNIKIDTSQIDQIFVNLTVNARDAISGVGTITIETGNISFNKNHDSGYSYIAPGDYVQLSVSDTGKGMEQQTIEHIFEPFFTTKGESGTGLGLSTVYGIVKQNEGSITVESEAGTGTIFRIYFPRFYGTDSIKADSAQNENLRGHETILIAEDEEQIRTLAGKILTGCGYRVIDTKSAAEAFLFSETYDGKIDLLLSDMIMPGMSGTDLRTKITKKRPGIKTLIMSGFAPQLIQRRGAPDEPCDFLQKPFTIDTLTKKVREILDRQPSE